MASTAEVIESKPETAELKEELTLHDIPGIKTGLKIGEDIQTEDAESEGLGRSLGALVGGGAALACSVFVAALSLPRYINSSAGIFLVVIGVLVVILIGGTIGAKVVKSVEGNSRSRSRIV